MAMNGEPVVGDPLGRALAAARAERPGGGWSALADDVMRRTRSVVRSDETVLARVGADGARTFVSTRVLLAALRRALVTTGDAAPDGIDFTVEGRELTGVSVSVAAAYGVDLHELAEGVRARVLEELAVLVPPVDGARPRGVDVAVVDVVDGDPRRV